MHLTSPFFVGGIDKLLPEARRTSVIDAQYGVAPARSTIDEWDGSPNDLGTKDRRGPKAP